MGVKGGFFIIQFYSLLNVTKSSNKQVFNHKSNMWQQILQGLTEPPELRPYFRTTSVRSKILKMANIKITVF
jgi:hypothetical protein